MFLQGKKTFIVAMLMIGYAITGVVAGYHDISRAIEIILEALAIMGLRIGIGSKQ